MAILSENTCGLAIEMIDEPIQNSELLNKKTRTAATPTTTCGLGALPRLRCAPPRECASTAHCFPSNVVYPLFIFPPRHGAGLRADGAVPWRKKEGGV
jgi:hypothetical protein